MALLLSNNGSIGCAYYVAAEEALYLQEDIPMAGMELVETLLLHVDPTTVLVSSRACHALVEYLERSAQNLDGDRLGELHRPTLVKDKY